MPNIQFKYNGQDFKANVTSDFLELGEEEQRRRLESDIASEHGLRSKPTGEKGFLHTLGLLERPAQALKVGVKESLLGGGMFKALGQIDLTPQEGFLTGLKRGWLGQDEIRTQDFLPDDLPGWYRGVLGFAGDVVTDPLTFSGGLIGKGIYTAGKGIRAMTPRPVALALQSVKESQKMQDFARALNVPLGDAKKVKGIATESGKVSSEIEHELAREVPKIRHWLEGKARDTGRSTETVHAAMRNWMDRRKLFTDHDEKPLTNKWYEKDGKIHAGDGDRYSNENLVIQKEIDNLRVNTVKDIGEDGIEYVDNWSNTLERMRRKEVADRINVPATMFRHYFPRELTPYGREAVEQKRFAEEFFPTEKIGSLDDPAVFYPKESYKHGRSLGEVGHDDINAEMFAAIEGTSKPNPADIPIEKQFFHGDPTVAIGLRWAADAASRQKQWFIDEVTDWVVAGRKVGASTEVKPYVNVGRWVRKDPDNPELFQQRIMQKGGSSAGIEDWVPLTEDMAGWQTVKGIPNKYVNEKSINDLAELDANTAQAMSLRKGDNAMDAAKKGREAFNKRWAETDRVEMVFKAPRNVAKQIEQQLDIMGASVPDHEGLKKFLKFYDGIQNPWKAWTLAVRPAYHTRNAIGNIFNAYIITGLGENIPKAISTFKDAAKLQYYARWEGSDLMRRQTVDRLRDMEKGAQTKFVESLPEVKDSDWLAANYADTRYSMREISDEALNRGITSGHYHKDINRDAVNKIEAAHGVGEGGRIARALGMDNPAVRAGFAFGGTIEGNARYAVFLNTLRKLKAGDDMEWIAPDGRKIKISEFDNPKHEFWTRDMKELPDGKFERQWRRMSRRDAEFDIASNEVKAALFDYSDLSVFERNWMKRLMPFYTWTRKNFPVQIKHLVLNPQRAEKLHLAKEQFEYETGELDWSDYGAFWGKRAPVFLGKESKGVIKAFTLLNTVPLAELQRIHSPRELITEMISPLPKELFEQLANYDTFRQRPITEYKGQSKDFLGVALPPRLWKLAQLMVPLGEINRLNPGGVFGQQLVDPVTGQQTVTRGWGGWGAMRESGPSDIAEAARWLRFFSGVRVYDINLDKQRYFMNKNLRRDLTDLKGKLKWAQARGENRRAEQLLLLIEAVQRQEEFDPMFRGR